MATGEGTERDAETNDDAETGGDAGAPLDDDVVAGGGYPAACDTAARRLLYDMVSIPSPSREEERAAERLVDFFEANGREAWIDEVGNVRAPANDAVLLTSHVDTVPGDIPVEVRPAPPEGELSEPSDVRVGEPGDPVLWGQIGRASCRERVYTKV